MPAEELAELARGVFGAERVHVRPRLDDAIEAAIALAEGEGIGLPGVLVTGSVVAVGEARTLLVHQAREEPTPAGVVDSDFPDDEWDADYAQDGSDPFADEELR